MNTQIITRILAKMNESWRRVDWNRIGTDESVLRGEGPPRGRTLNDGWSNTFAVPNRGLAGKDGGIPEGRKV